MRVDSSVCRQSLRVKADVYYGGYQTDETRERRARFLNLELLLSLLRVSCDDSPSLKNKGKKRAAAHSPPGASVTKRARTDGNDRETTIDLTEESVPVYRHVFDIRYNTDAPATASQYVEDVEASGLGWLDEETALVEWLSQECEGLVEPKSLDLGTLHLRLHNNQLLAFPEAPSDVNPLKCLLIVPKIYDHINSKDYDYRWLSDREDILQACHHLQRAGRAEVTAKLSCIFAPFDANKTSGLPEFPFRLHVDVTISLIMPIIFEPITPGIYIEEKQRRVLSHLFQPSAPAPESFHGTTDIPFFLSVLGPAPNLPSTSAEQAAQPEAITATLLPFQRRSVAWMLSREGKTISDTGEVIVKTNLFELPLFWERVVVGCVEDETAGTTWYFNRLTGRVSLEPPADDSRPGGILAEEPGLGKTVECISLISLNPAEGRDPSHKRWDPQAKIEAKEIKTTLIVTPASLASQWVDELRQHAPALKVCAYDGWAKLKVPITEAAAEEAKQSRLTQKGKKKAGGRTQKAGKRSQRVKDSYNDDMDLDEDQDQEAILDWCSYVNTFDVCITTYNVLQNDLNVARPPPRRPRRDTATYSNLERPRSPLIMCEWYRVIMDEVQMVGGGKTEEMVSMIPRLSSFAVSGTPARSQVSDLIHVLNFIRLGSAIASSRLWNRLLLPGHASEFVQLFQRYAVRTMKSAVQSELTIPSQTRYLVGIELGSIERHVYDENLNRALDELGLDARGIAVSEGWEVDTTVLRSWLRKLRGICTHPQVGQLQGQRDKLSRPGALKTMAEVLEGMVTQNWRNLIENRKSKINSLCRRAQLRQQDDNDPKRYQQALDVLLQAEKEANQLIEDLKANIADHDSKGVALKQEAAAHREALRQTVASSDLTSSADKGKGRAEVQGAYSPDSEDDSEDDDLPQTPAGKEYRDKRRGLQSRLREAYITLHKVKFFLGDVYHVLGGSHSESEDAAYSAADKLRRDLLRGTEQAAVRAMTALASETSGKRLTEQTLMISVPHLDQGGIRTYDLVEEANEMIDELLNAQSALLWKWRRHIVSLLTQRLSSNEGEATGQEYAQSLDTQGEAETYLQAYAALMADRREVLVAERTALATVELKEKKARKTKVAQQAAAEDDFDMAEDVEIQPEHEVLRKELMDARRKLLEQFNGRAIKSVMVDLSTVANKIQDKKDVEKIIAQQRASQLRQLISSQGTVNEKLEADLAQMRKAFNERILYFRQLQEISDSVAESTWEGSLTNAIQVCTTEEEDLLTQINTGRARQRYLDHLAKAQKEGTLDEDEEACILCRCDFKRGYITQCAHVFCESCMKAWLARREGKACPVCRVIINVDQLERFSVGADKDKEAPPPRVLNGELVPTSRRQIEYNFIVPEQFNEIQKMESYGSYGSKIQTLVRHLLYLQDTDPGAKSIVFSAWADSLHIVEHALIHNGIPCLRIDQNQGKRHAAKRFRDQPEILVLLLHGERENAGLNVTCASRVFMLESVVHHAFELQAIARIDRMGQQKPTEVYCYYAEDTVERTILDLAARQGLSLYTKDKAGDTLNVSSFAMEPDNKAMDASVKKKVQKGDFIFKTDDMLAILFPHMFEDIELLLPEEDLATQAQSQGQAGSSRPSGNRLPAQVNAVAGPSRLAY